MSSVWNSAVALLLVTGGLLGAVFPLGKLATEAGVAPVAWSFLLSAGVVVVLGVAMAIRRERIGLGARKLRYFAIAGLISYAIPNVLVFLAIPRLGAGFTGIMFTLSPVITLTLAVLFRIRRPNALGIGGIAVGFLGAVIVAATRGQLGQPADPVWIGAGLLIPLSLACGNIYRTLDWPKKAGPLELAVGSHAGAAAALALYGLAAGGLDLTALAAVPVESLLQVSASAAMFVFFFRLQQVGGPVYLSQIGYVAAAVGLVAATVFLDESYALLTWIGALVIGAGVALTTKAQANGA